MKLFTDDRVVFYGDSITAAGRDHHQEADLGCGYVRAVAATALAADSPARLALYNRGVSGNRTLDLGPRMWVDDGVHPTPSGHEMLARAWLAA